MDKITSNVYNSILTKREENLETPHTYHPRKVSSFQQSIAFYTTALMLYVSLNFGVNVLEATYWPLFLGTTLPFDRDSNEFF